MTSSEHNDWSQHMASMLGKEVAVMLDATAEKVIVRGKLLSFSEDGEVAIQDEDGAVHWCWPNLHTELA